MFSLFLWCVMIGELLPYVYNFDIQNIKIISNLKMIKILKNVLYINAWRHNHMNKWWLNVFICCDIQKGDFPIG